MSVNEPDGGSRPSQPTIWRGCAPYACLTVGRVPAPASGRASAGKGIAALQEAGKLPLDSVSFPRIDLLGIYPNLEGLAMQGGLLMLAMLLLWSSEPRRRVTA